MSTRSANATMCVALIGNPNTGKSTLFGALAGVRQRVGNYPGVTVEKKIGQMRHDGGKLTLVDLPGTYSLAPRSPDEMVTVDVLLGRQPDSPRPDAVLCIVDASNLQRNLYLVSQVLELGLPTIVALNMVDVARERGITIDVARLQDQLGVPIVEVQANRRIGLDALRTALAAAATRLHPPPPSPFPEAFQAEVRQLESRISTATPVQTPDGVPRWPRFLVERVLLDTTGYLEGVVEQHGDETIHDEVRGARQRLAAAGYPVPAVEAMSRYAWAARVLDGVVHRPAERPVTPSDRIDRVLTHRLGGVLVFVLLMAIVFQAVFSWATVPADLIEAGIRAGGEALGSLMPDGALRSLLVDGAIAGVGGVLVFLPQILVLFFFIAVLEDCGYMARAAYLMDRLMAPLGLSGKSFIPLLSSFACAIPGVMAARVIENKRDRLTTILIAPLMSCSARLPVYTLLIGAFIPNWMLWEIPIGSRGIGFGLQGVTLLAMYSIGIVAAAVVALVLKRTLLRGPTPPFVMELPSYKWPSLATVVHRMLERGWSFVYRAGTLILAVSILIWAALYYPHDSETIEAPFRAEQEQLTAQLAAAEQAGIDASDIEAQLDVLDHRIAGAYQRQSFLGRAGHWIEPVVRPLGWDWRIGCAVIASFPAREVVVATLGVIYNLGSDVEPDDDTPKGLQAALRDATWDETDRPVFTVPVALSVMVFFALCAQCAATLVVIRRETNSWGWAAFTFVYMTTLAYVGALLTYQVATALAG